MAKQSKASFAEEIQQSQPFSCLEEECYLSLMRTSAELSHRTDQFLKPFRITQAQYNVLRILSAAGPKGLGRNEIAERMLTPTPDASRLLDRLEEAGWIRRKRDTNDRRQVTSCITATGRKRLARVERPLAAFYKNQCGGISQPELKRFLRRLSDLRNESA